MLQLGDEYFGVQISVRSNAEFQLAWSDELQVIYQLSGRTYISMDESYFLMKQNDLFVINPYEVVDISLQGMLLCLSFSSYLTAPVNGIQFLCRSFCYGEESQDQFDTLRSELAEILKIYLFREEENKVDLLSHIYAFLNLLVKFFTAKKDIGREYDNNYSRLTLLLKYIQENYQQKISLGDLADITFFAPNYISHFFRDKMGTTFSNYLNDVRMKHAFYELCHTSKNITAIAMDNGFSSTNVFISRFREKYGVTPKKYRLGVQFQETDWKGGKDSHDSAISMDSFQALLQYGKIVQPHIPIPKEPVIRNIALNAADQPTQLYHDWRLIINAGYAFSCLSESVQKQLEIAKREIGFEYVRFHGLFNDNMQVYFEAENGTPCLRFQTVDLLFDKLLELSYKPYIEFGYVPQLLATNNSSIFETRSYISYPKDMEKWIYMVQTFLKHMMQRYGTKRIREWRFSLFGISFTQYGHLSRDEYYQLHKYTYQTVKDVDEQLKFCGPGFEGSLLLAKNEQVSKQFLERCMKEKCVPDYITAHSYPHSFQELIKNYKRIRSERDLQATLRLSDNEHFMQDVICSLKNTLAKLNLTKSIIIDEWSSTIWPRDTNNDTSYKASYIIKNMIENMDAVAGKGCWTLSDGVGEWRPEHHIFYGGQGLFTFNGIQKAAFYAFTLLARLGDSVIARGNGYYVTRDASGIQILLYHYAHYNAIYQLDTTRNSIDFPSDGQKAVKYVISLKGMEEEKFKLRYYKISREYGNAFNEWRRMGEENELTSEDREYLVSRSMPARTIELRNTLEGIEVVLDPNDVALIIINPT